MNSSTVTDESIKNRTYPKELDEFCEYEAEMIRVTEEVERQEALRLNNGRRYPKELDEFCEYEAEMVRVTEEVERQEALRLNNSRRGHQNGVKNRDEIYEEINATSMRKLNDTVKKSGSMQPQPHTSSHTAECEEADKMDPYNQTFVISEAAHWDSQQKFKKNKPIAIHETGVTEGWLRVELAWTVRAWLVQSERGHVLHVECRTCHARRPPLALHTTLRPFLVLYTKYGAKKRRQRHLECGPGVKECCREPLYVNFTQLGWDDWIIQPAGYHAYFCKGNCAPVSAVAQSANYHHTIIKKYFYSLDNGERKAEMKPCCAPTSFSSMQLFYMDSNNSVTQKTLPNMVVETCGCM